MKLALPLTLFTLMLWSSLAFLGTHLSRLPAFLVTGIALCIGGLISLPRARLWRVPAKTLAVGVGGIFGYHFLYFTAFRLAPPVEVNLMNYLWPLLIVVLTPALLPGHTLRPQHLIGAALGLAGAGLIVTGGRVELDLANLPGYACAAAAALIWAIYSLLTRRLPPFPTEAVGGFCLISGLLSLGFYAAESAATGQFIAPAGSDWALLAGLGIGPMGLAFFTWSAALKRGDPRIIGALSYLTPLASTLLLVLLGGRTLTAASGFAMLLIVAGALIGSLDVLRGSSRLSMAGMRDASR